MLLEFLILVVIALFLFYRWSVATHDFWLKRGVPFDKPYPLLGSLKDSLCRKTAFFDLIIELYNRHHGNVFGVFDQRLPVLLIRDPELIKKITIKDFEHFVNHRTLINEADHDGIFGSSLFSMQDAKWKDMRSTLSPAFTGNKMRQMFDLMSVVAKESVAYLQEEKDNTTTKELEIDMKDYSTRFTNDVIASTAFGIQINSFKDKDNEFYTIGKKTTTFTNWQNMKFFLYANFRTIMRLLNMKIFDDVITKYFMYLVLDAMKYRQQHNVFRPDMINILMEARGMIKTDNPKVHSREWTDIEIVSQCFIFFFAGFETVSVLTCFVAHELMENPDVQEKLFQEIEEATEKLDGKPVSYDVIQGMKYMDMVISETLRKWPPSMFFDRICNKDYVCQAGDLQVEIKKGQVIWVPVSGLHRDPKYFPNPKKFDPERFSDENKSNIEPFTYLPFGAGPRVCIASRFAQLEAKAIIFYLLREFRLEAGKKTKTPIVLKTGGFNMQPKDGFWLKLMARHK